MKSTKTDFSVEVGFKRGLLAAGAKPATSRHAAIRNKIDHLADAHGAQLSAGGNTDRLNEIFRERLEIEKGRIRSLNQELARDAAARVASFSEGIKRRYETNPSARVADILDSQARIGLMDKGQLTVMADELLSGARTPKHEYELIEVIKRLPKHELKAEYARRDDIALWLPEGKEAFEEMRRYATLGDRLAFEAEDGAFISASVNDLYAPPQYTPREMAERASTVN